jgi:hypothetical protein
VPAAAYLSKVANCSCHVHRQDGKCREALHEQSRNPVPLRAFVASFLVPGAGLEPAHSLEPRILSPLCLPVPPSGHIVSVGMQLLPPLAACLCPGTRARVENCAQSVARHSSGGHWSQAHARACADLLHASAIRQSLTGGNGPGLPPLCIWQYFALFFAGCKDLPCLNSGRTYTAGNLLLLQQRIRRLVCHREDV